MMMYSNPDASSLDLSSDSVDKGAPIIVEGEQVGTLIVSSSLGRLPAYLHIFVSQVNGLLLIATVAAVVAVLNAAAISPNSSWLVTGMRCERSPVEI